MGEINITLDSFEGPLSLLCHLIEKNKIDIYDIPIAEVTDQYIEVINSSAIKDMDIMSEFLVMAAELLEIKSKMLLPKPKTEEEEEIDPRDELVAKLIEYKKFKNITETFKSKEDEAKQVLFKEADEVIAKLKKEDTSTLEDFLDGVSLEDIFRAYEEVISRRSLKVDRVRSSFKSVEKDIYTIEDKMAYIGDLLILNPRVQFGQIFKYDAPKAEIVVTFLALLELIKNKTVRISQDRLFDEIIISRF